jgi:hypothetical protein
LHFNTCVSSRISITLLIAITLSALTLFVNGVLGEDEFLPGSDDYLELRQILIFHSVNGETKAITNFCKSHLMDGAKDVRYGRTEDVDQWVVGAPDGVLTPDRFYEVNLGPDVRLAITATGSWIAAGGNGTISNGQTVKNSRTAKAIYEDMYKWENLSLSQSDNLSGRTRSDVSSTRPYFNDSSSKGTHSKDSSTNDGSYRNTNSHQDTDSYRDNPSMAENSDQEFPRIPVNLDTSPPYVEKIEIVRFPDIPEKRRVSQPPSVFVGAEAIEIKVYMSETMGSAPEVRISQPSFTAIKGALTNNQSERIFTYRWFPNSSPGAQGPTKLEVMGEYDGNAPDFGYDLALNPIVPDSNGSVYESAMIVDTVAPDLKRIGQSNGSTGSGQSIPQNGATLSKDDFPKTIMVFVEDYNNIDDGTESAENVATSAASGVDFSLISANDGSISLRLFKPDGSEINGIIVARQPALELILPDVYDPVNQIFPDNDNDGISEPVEGTYRIEISITDKVGNKSSHTINFGMDTTPVSSSQLNVSITPVFTTPFTNPDNPIGETGTFVKQFRGVEVTSDSPEWSPARSSVELEKWVPGEIPYPTLLKTNIEKDDNKIMVTILMDQDGDGVNDFENPERGQYVPEGERDPRWGKNDGVYIIKVKAFDNAGNSADLTKRLTIDTTPPEIETTFPNAEITIGPPLRMVDALIIDPKPVSGADASGIHFDHFNIRVEFMGNENSSQQMVNGVGFIHEPNNTDPTIPSYNPNDEHPKLLFEFTDESGHVTPLPEDGSMDGVYTIHLSAWDKAGSEVSGSVGFSYSSTAPSSGTTEPAETTETTPPVTERLIMRIQ